VAGSVAGGDFVVKVKDIGPAFRQEPFALATSAAFHFVNGPSLAISCTNNNPLPNHTVTITCTAANQGDLPISGLTATLTWKNGTGGSLPNTWSFSEKGVTGDTQTVTFQGPAPQAPPLDNGGYTITLAGTNYGEPRSWSTEGDIFGTDCTNGFWLNPTGQAIGEDMKQVQFQMFVPSTCAWTTSTTQHADWVSINPPGGKGNATITVTVLATPAVIDPTIPNGTNGLAIQFTSGGILGGKFNLVFGKDGTGLSAQGLVRNPNQLPIAGATVTFTGAGAPAPVVTDAGGAWSQKGFSNTVSYTATASKPGYNFTVNNVPFTGGTTANVQMIGSSQYTASGQVISKYGKSIAGVTLTFAATNTTGTRSAPAPVTTDANGNWTQAGFESGTPYQVTPSRGTTSFSPSYRAFSDLTAPNMSLNFQDPTTFNASGIVQTKNGVPIPGVTVAFATDYGPRQNWVQTDATGRWSQTGFDPYVVNTAPLLLAGYTFSPATLTIGPAELLATGTSPYSASGTIVNSFGIALDGIVITITPDQGTAPNPFTTLKDGKFSFSELEKLTKYTLVPAKASYQFNPPSLVVTGPSTTLQFTAALVRPVSGTVVNPRGEPLSGAVVSFTRTSDKQPAPGNTNADAKGAWLQNGFESGTGIVYQATATLANYTFTPRSAVHAGDTGVTITGTPGKFTASGTVTLPAGASPTGVSLQFALALTTEHKGPVPANQNPSSTGAWSLAGFEDGTTYRVTPVRSGYTFSPAYLDFTVDKSTGLNFTGAKN
jgi:hypothetical protein